MAQISISAIKVSPNPVKAGGNLIISVKATGGVSKGSLSLDKTSITLNISNMTDTIKVTRAGNGAITATSNNTSVATVSVSGTTITVTGKKTGNVTVTVNVAATDDYTAPQSKTCTVTVSLPHALLADNTPADIKAAADAGVAPNFWSVGDKIDIPIRGQVGHLIIDVTYQAVIIGFNHNSNIEGNNTIHFQIGKDKNGVDIAFCDNGYAMAYNSGVSSRFVMNRTATNANGWEQSYMRTTICTKLINIMPSDWDNVISACTKYTDNLGDGVDDGRNVTATTDKIFLLSEYEIFGFTSYSNMAEADYQKQYDYYKNGNNTVRFKHNATATPCVWWTRSPEVGMPKRFCAVYEDGSNNSAVANLSYGFAPCFKIGG